MYSVSIGDAALPTFTNDPIEILAARMHTSIPLAAMILARNSMFEVEILVVSLEVVWCGGHSTPTCVDIARVQSGYILH
jgi:hypothetical protein